VQSNSLRVNGLHRQDRFAEGLKFHKTSLISEDLGVLCLQTSMTYDLVDAAVAIRLPALRALKPRLMDTQQNGMQCRDTPARSEGIETLDLDVRAHGTCSPSRYACPL
jgi:hypothetical protein